MSSALTAGMPQMTASTARRSMVRFSNSSRDKVSPQRIGAAISVKNKACAGLAISVLIAGFLPGFYDS